MATDTSTLTGDLNSLSVSETSTTPSHFQDPDGQFALVCPAFMNKKRCKNSNCSKIHDKNLCSFYYKTGTCKFDADCRKKHHVTTQEKKPQGNGKEVKKLDEKKSKGNNKHHRVPKKNTECFVPKTTPVDVRIVYDLGNHTTTCSQKLTTRDVLLVPNLFSDYPRGKLYESLETELNNCTIPQERLFKMWHGNNEIDGTHLIADDKTQWKKDCPTFQMILDRLKEFFNMKIQATRFNLYKDTSQWKPFHFDAAAMKPEIAKRQNFTVAVSFGATRDAAFEHAKTKTVVSMPQPDSSIYAFASDTNVIWRHGILQDIPTRDEGRISVIAWGWIHGMIDTTATTT